MCPPRVLQVPLKWEGLPRVPRSRGWSKIHPWCNCNAPKSPQRLRFVERTVKIGGYNVVLGGGNSNIFYFHPENWGRFPF